MAYSLLSNSGDVVTNINEYICDTYSDLANLPKTARPGSTAYITSTSRIYIKDNAGNWIVKQTYTSGGGSGTGADGKSAYEIACDEGFNGTVKEWLESLKGDSPKIGEDGYWYVGESSTGVKAIPVAISSEEILQIIKEVNLNG